MDTVTMTIAEFLLARIAGDQQWARWLQETQRKSREWMRIAELMLAESEAKRRIVERADADAECVDHGGALYSECAECQAALAVTTADELVLRDLAAVYAGHADYREEWRP